MNSPYFCIIAYSTTKKPFFNGLIENEFSFFSISPSKNPYGNKTINKDFMKDGKSYSSKNPYGNKTSNTYYHIFD